VSSSLSSPVTEWTNPGHVQKLGNQLQGQFHYVSWIKPDLMLPLHLTSITPSLVRTEIYPKANWHMKGYSAFLEDEWQWALLRVHTESTESCGSRRGLCSLSFQPLARLALNTKGHIHHFPNSQGKVDWVSLGTLPSHLGPEEGTVGPQNISLVYF
jgi:hypothetical protein